MCDEAVDDSLAALKLIPDRFVTSKMIKTLFTALHADEIYSILMKILLRLYLIVKIGILNIDFVNNFDEDDLDTIILIRRLAWHIKFEKRKELKKKISEEY